MKPARRSMRRRLWAVAVLVALCGLGEVAAAPTVTEHMTLDCSQPEPLRLLCAYRLRAGGELRSADAELEGVTTPGTLTHAPVPESAWLILVDTSDPARQPVVERAATEIARLLELGPPQARFGLARFDTDLFVLAPLGSERAAIADAARGLRAEGRTTELYRNVRDAVQLLGRERTERKVLLLLSDGLAEDRAYDHADVIAAAHAAGVTIAAIGYPRSVGQSVALQTLRRLVDETGGLYVQAGLGDFAIPDDYLPQLVEVLGAGGEAEFDLTPFAGAGAGLPVDLSLTFATTTRNLPVLVPVTLPKVGVAAPAAVPLPPTAPLAPAPTPPVPRALTPWLVLFGFLLVAILAATGAVLRRLRRAAAGGPVEHHARPLAWLIAQDPPGRRHAVDKTPWRIGRTRNADLSLNDHSVSRLHAEIRRSEGGTLTLNDLESLNGVFVNDTRIESIELREGDAVDIGDVRLVFTLHDEDYASEEPTVLVRTRTPL